MATKKTFDFKMGDRLKIKLTGEQGVIYGRLHHVEMNPRYDLHYVKSDGSAAEGWFYESELELVEAGAGETESAAA